MTPTPDAPQTATDARATDGPRMGEVALVEQLSSGKVSARAQYARMFVGKPGLIALLLYELCMSWPSQACGAFGYMLRKKLYPRLMGACGRGCLFGRGVLLRSPGNIHFGDAVILDDLCVVDAKGDRSRITIGNQVLISRYGIVTCSDATLSFGDYCSIGPYCNFASKSFIEIGSYTSIGPGSQVIAGGHAFDDPDVPVVKQRRISKGIRIGSGCWLGAGVIVTDGSVIGDNCIIGAGAMVKGEIPPYSVAVGTPARVLYDRREKRTTAPTPAGPRT